MKDKNILFMKQAIVMAESGMNSNAGGPFGAVIVKGGKIIAKGYNQVTSTNDPTAHAEIVAIRHATQRLNSFQLDECILYTSCEPCPMCLGAIYWARIQKVYFACNKKDAERINFDDQFIYKELDKDIQKRSVKFIPLMREEGLNVFEKWHQKNDKTTY